jgi:predicted MFS family arabinose efflux permease
MLDRTLKTYYSFSFLFGVAISFFFASYVIFLISRGISLLEVGLINSAFIMGIALFEIPTGSFSDTYGRKKSIIISCFLLSISFLIYYSGERFHVFFLAEMIGALAHAFYSGALDSWAVDDVLAIERHFNTDDIIRRGKVYGRLGHIFGTLAGAYGASFDLALPWLLSSIGMASMGLIAVMFIKESSPGHIGRRHIGMLACARAALECSRKKPILFIMATAFIFGLAIMPLNLYWQPIFRDGLGIPLERLGWVHALAILGVFAGILISDKAKALFKKDRDRVQVSLILLFVGIFFAALGRQFWLVFIPYLVHEVARGLYEVSKDQYLHSRAETRIRSSTVSVMSMSESLGKMLGILVGGFIAEHLSPESSWLFSAVMIAVSTPILFRIKNGE